MRGASFLLALGLLQMVGDLTGSAPLKGIGAATAASPAPRVFSSVQGLETYSTRFFIEWRDVTGQVANIELTPETQARIAGPYNRRNVYGAAVAYGPVFVDRPATDAMFRAVASAALCGPASLLGELGVDPATVGSDRWVRYEPLADADTSDLPLRIEIECP